MKRERFGETNIPPEEKKTEEKMTYPEAAERLDAMVLKNLEDGITRKLKNESASDLLTGLKGEIIDPLYENAWLKGEENIGQYENKEELKSFLRDSIEKRYRTFLVPGRVSYDRETGESRIARPSGLGFETQIMLLEETGLIKNSEVKFFEAGRENGIPAKDLEKGLKLYVNDEARKKYGPEMKAGPTEVLYDVLSKAGFFDKMENPKKLEIMGTVLFTGIIERNEWLEPTTENFFDAKKIDLFKINRNLNYEQISGVIRDFLSDTRVNWNDFGETLRKVKETVVKKGKEVLSEEFIRKHHLENAVKRQKESIFGSFKFLKSGRGVTFADLGQRSKSEIIYVKNPSSKWKDGAPEHLPGQLPAIAAEPALDWNTHKPLWRPKNAYFEVNGGFFSGYVKRSGAAHLLNNVEKYAKEHKMNPQISKIGGWVKIFVPLSKKNRNDFSAKLENQWLKIGRNGEKVKKPGKSPAKKAK